MRSLLSYSAVLAVIVLAVVIGVQAAPVPKMQPKVEEAPLVIQQGSVEGEWKYEWNTMLDGWIVFDKSGSYTAKHIPSGTVTYYGSYAVSDNSITLTEYGSDDVSGNTWGPSLYRFEFDLKKWPAPAGKSTSGYGFDVPPPQGSLHVKLRDRVKK